MAKQLWKPGTMIYPLPAVMVSCGDSVGNYNIITVSWVGTLCSEPPMCYVSVRKSRHSHRLIEQTRSFVINLTTVELARKTDWCGVKSGKEVNKFIEMNLTPVKAHFVVAPMIAESPMNIECKVTEIKELGTHDMFIAEVLAVHADEKYINNQTGAFDMEQADLLAYSHGNYYALGKKIGHFGFSVRKKKSKK